MPDTAAAVLQGNGMESTSFQMLIKLVEQMGQTSATLKNIDAGLTDLRNTTNQQLSLLQERVGKGEALNEVQNERIKQAEKSDVELRAELLAQKASHEREMAELKNSHALELQALRTEIQESSRMRWMIRGGMLVVAVVWPILWQLVILPMFSR